MSEREEETLEKCTAVREYEVSLRASRRYGLKDPESKGEEETDMAKGGVKASLPTCSAKGEREGKGRKGEREKRR